MQPAQIIKSSSEYLANRNDVLFAYLFGSHAKGSATDRSDIDIAVFMDEDKGAKIDKLQFIQEISEALNTDSLDLVILNSAPIALINRVLQKNILLVDRNGYKRHLFESLNMRKYFDFSIYEKGILEKRFLNG